MTKPGAEQGEQLRVQLAYHLAIEPERIGCETDFNERGFLTSDEWQWLPGGE